MVFQENVNGSWQTLSTVSTNGSGVATLSVSPTSTRKYRARFAADSSYVSSRSSVLDMTVRVLKNITKRFICDWSQTYNVNDTQHSSTHLYQSMRESTLQKRKSLAGFDHVKIQEFLTTYYAAVSIKFSVKLRGVVRGKTLLLGTHDYTSKPTTWSDARVDQNLETLTECEGGNRYTVTMDSALIADFASGASVGFALGPATSDSSVYELSAVGNDGTAEEPWIEITVQKWLPT